MKSPQASSMLLASFIPIFVAGANAAYKIYSIWPQAVTAMDKNQKLTDDFNSRTGTTMFTFKKAVLLIIIGTLSSAATISSISYGGTSIHRVINM